MATVYRRSNAKSSLISFVVFMIFFFVMVITSVTGNGIIMTIFLPIFIVTTVVISFIAQSKSKSTKDFKGTMRPSEPEPIHGKDFERNPRPGFHDDDNDEIDAHNHQNTPTLKTQAERDYEKMAHESRGYCAGMEREHEINKGLITKPTNTKERIFANNMYPIILTEIKRKKTEQDMFDVLSNYLGKISDEAYWQLRDDIKSILDKRDKKR